MIELINDHDHPKTNVAWCSRSMFTNKVVKRIQYPLEILTNQIENWYLYLAPHCKLNNNVLFSTVTPRLPKSKYCYIDIKFGFYAL